jgi:two-component system, sensor histidine kinase PdtaS
MPKRTLSPKLADTTLAAQVEALQADIDALRAQLAEALLSKAEAEETLRAIQQGEVDAILIERPDGPRTYTLHGADYAYQALVESMNEGALTVDPGGLVLYANRHLAEMLSRPLETLLGAALLAFVAPEDAQALDGLLQASRQGQRVRGEIRLVSQAGARLPTQFAVSPLPIEGLQGASIIVSDLNWRRPVA